MGSHPVNLTVRFLLELAALVVFGVWGWQMGEGWVRFLLALGVPVAAAAVWGTFAVPDDPSRSGRAPVPVPGVVRLVLELLFFGAAVWMLYGLGFTGLSVVLAGVVVVHYLVSYDRIQWLFSH